MAALDGGIVLMESSGGVEPVARTDYLDLNLHHPACLQDNTNHQLYNNREREKNDL